MAEAAVWPVLLGVVGAVLGSFIATVALRWPASALGGRSGCDGCGATLRWWELVPLVSWLALRGRCARCGAGIAPLHPAIECMGLAIGAAAGFVAPGVAGAAGAVFGWLLLALAAIDVVAFRLPNALTAALAMVGLASALLLPPSLADRTIGGVAGFASLWTVAAVYRAVRHRDGLGGGDAKLFGAIGLWIGWRALPGVLLAASLSGLVVIVAMMLAGRRLTATDRLPFGAMLALGGFGFWLVATI